MLYGFEHQGELFVVAADSQPEFDEAPEWFADMDGVEFYIPELTEMVSEQKYSGLVGRPVVITTGSIPSTLVRVTSRVDALSFYARMSSHSVARDSVEAMFALYQSEYGVDEEPVDDENLVTLSAEDILASNACNMSEFIFTASHTAGDGTTVTIVSEQFFLETGEAYYNKFEANCRMGSILDLPETYYELGPGIFEYDGSPLAARKELLSLGLRDSPDLFDYVYSIQPSLPDAATFEETVDALKILAPNSGKDFFFALCEHKEKSSVYAVIIPSFWMLNSQEPPRNIYITPLVKDIIPNGFGERRPAIFEMLGSRDVALERLLSVGMVEYKALNKIVQREVSTVKKVAPAPTAPVDWRSALASWDELDAMQRNDALPDSEFSFCVLDDVSGNNLLFLVPTGYFAANEKLLSKDLDLDARLMGSAEKVGPNIFRVSGLSSLDLTALMVRNNFRESYGLLLHVNLCDFPEIIGFDTI